MTYLLQLFTNICCVFHFKNKSRTFLFFHKRANIKACLCRSSPIIGMEFNSIKQLIPFSRLDSSFIRTGALLQGGIDAKLNLFFILLQTQSDRRKRNKNLLYYLAHSRTRLINTLKKLLARER